MIVEQLLRQAASSAPSRRRFLTTTVGGALGLALMPLARAQNAPKLSPGQNPTEQPVAFVSIAKDGTTTILCNRMDMGQGIETGLAMICAEELEADWSKVVTGFGDQKGHYVDPAMGMHLTGGSNSIKNSYTQYRELGARLRAMLISAGSLQWGVPPAQLKAENGVVSGAGRIAPYGELFEAAIKLPVPEKVVLKDPKSFRLIG
ncbi:MAG: molybdopterin cofactor-binding domain-containing protein, partial [Inhella sp.]